MWAVLEIARIAFRGGLEAELRVRGYWVVHEDDATCQLAVIENLRGQNTALTRVLRLLR